MSTLQPLILRKRDELVLAVFDEVNNTCKELHEAEGHSSENINNSNDLLVTSYPGDYRECDVCFHPLSTTHFAHASTTTLTFSAIVELPESSSITASTQHNNVHKEEKEIEEIDDDATSSCKWRMQTIFSTAMPHVVIDLCFSSQGRYLVTYAQMDPKRTINGNLMIFAVPNIIASINNSHNIKSTNSYSQIKHTDAQCVAQFKQVRWPALCWSGDESLLIRSVIGQLHVLNGNITTNTTLENNTNDNGNDSDEKVCEGTSNILVNEESEHVTNEKTNNNQNNNEDEKKKKKSNSISCLDLALPTNKDIVFSTAPVSSISGAPSAPLLAFFKPFHKQRQSSFTLYRLPYIGHHESELISYNFGKAEQAHVKWSASGKYIALMVESEKSGSQATNSYYAHVRLYLVDIANRRVEEVKVDSLSLNAQSSAKSGSGASFKTVGKGARLADLPLNPSLHAASSSSSAPPEAVHECQWNPVKDELLIIHGVMPRNKATLLDVKTKTVLAKFNEAPRNTALWSSNGKLLLLGGSGNLAGDYQVYSFADQTKINSSNNNKDANTYTNDMTVKCTGEFNEKCSVELWSPNGYHLLCATLFTKLRMGNKVVFFKSNGVRLLTIKFDELYGVHWIQMKPIDAYGFRPPSPLRSAQSNVSQLTNNTNNVKQNEKQQLKSDNKQERQDGEKIEEEQLPVAAKPKIYVPPGGHSRAALLLRRTNDSTAVNESVNNNSVNMAKKSSGPVGGTVMVSNKKKGKGKKH